MKVTKLLALGLGLAALGASPIIAADNTVEQSSDRSRNPLTGTVTETEKSEVKKTDPATGKQYKEKYVKKRKIKDDGSVETTVDQDKSAE